MWFFLSCVNKGIYWDCYTGITKGLDKHVKNFEKRGYKKANFRTFFEELKCCWEKEETKQIRLFDPS